MSTHPAQQGLIMVTVHPPETSWWLDRPREGFTAYVWREQYTRMTGRANALELAKLRRRGQTREAIDAAA